MATYINGQFYYGEHIKIETAVNLSPNTPIINQDYARYGRLFVHFDIQDRKIVLTDISGLCLHHKLYKSPKGKQVQENQLFLEKWINHLEDSPEKQRILEFVS
jgi:hypothetical protein